MEETKLKNEMPEDLDAYIIKGLTECRWSFEFMVKDLQRFGIEEQLAWSIVSRVVKENNIEQSTNSNTDSDDSTLSNDLSSGATIAIGIALFAGLVFALAKSSFAELGMFLVIMVLVGSAILSYFLTIPTDKRIIHKLRNAGYECGMHEGQINFKKNNCTWTIFTSNVSKRYRKAAFYLGFDTEDLDKDHALANRIVCIIGHRNPTVVTNWNGKDSVRFMYHTVFSSTKDILREFSSATDALDTAASEFFALKERAFDEAQSTTEHKVGFQYGDKPEFENNEIRAQKETETTN